MRLARAGRLGDACRMGREIAKAYEPQQIEPRWAEFWVKEELFKADPSAPGPAFSMAASRAREMRPKPPGQV